MEYYYAPVSLLLLDNIWMVYVNYVYSMHFLFLNALLWNISSSNKSVGCGGTSGLHNAFGYFGDERGKKT